MRCGLSRDSAHKLSWACYIHHHLRLWTHFLHIEQNQCVIGANGTEQCPLGKNKRTFEIFISGAKPAGNAVWYFPSTGKLWEWTKGVATRIIVSCNENSSVQLCHDSALEVKPFLLGVLGTDPTLSILFSTYTVYRYCFRDRANQLEHDLVKRESAWWCASD